MPHVVPTQLHPVFLHIALLPPLCLPARVRRRADATLIWVDPRALRAELAFWSLKHLTDNERLTLRMAFGQPMDLSTPMDDEFLAGCAGTLLVPPMLRLPQDDPVFGSVGTG